MPRLRICFMINFSIFQNLNLYADIHGRTVPASKTNKADSYQVIQSAKTYRVPTHTQIMAMGFVTMFYNQS